MKEQISDFQFKVSDVLLDSGEVISESREIPIWKVEGLDDFKITSLTEVKANFQKIDKGTVLGIFEVRLDIDGSCFYCLESVKRSLLFSTEASFSVYDNLEDVEFKISKYGDIDIQSLLEQEIITHLPQNFSCQAGCKGLCPKCGINLNHDKCVHNP